MEKTEYFTEHSIAQQAQSIYHNLDSKLALHRDQFEPNKSALLILDMQKFFIDRNSHAFVPSAHAIIKPILSLVKLFLEHKRPIIVTRHVNTAENAKQMDYWWRDILTADNKLSHLIDEIAKIDSRIITKSQYDAFHGTDLHSILQDSDVEQLIVTGVMTHLCCETTARSAFVQGYNVFFPIDGTATYNLDFHNASLTNLAHGFANITLTEKLVHNFDDQ